METSLPANPAQPQATTRAGVLMPALVPEPFDYLVPEGTREGALVEATLAGRKLVGAVWRKTESRVESRESSVSSLRGGGADVAIQTIEQAVPSTGLPRFARNDAPLVLDSRPSTLDSKKKSFTLKPVIHVLDHLPPLPAAYRQWLDWISAFTLAPKGAVLSLCGLAHAAKQPKKPYAQPPFAITLPTLTDAQQKIADILSPLVAPAHAGVRAAFITSQKDVRIPAHGRDNKPILLDGVTGSGKTEVYFHAIAAALGAADHGLEAREETPSPLAGEDGRGGGVSGAIAPIGTPPLPSPPPRGGRESLTPGPWPLAPQILVLLPEIALTHQWLARFEQTFGTAPVVWHSRMSPVQKARAWQAVARGEVPVVVGARSALFLPFANLQLIVVDEEHDPSYKQEDGVLYHARDMAVARARFETIPILLVSATPSLETLENVREGKYRVLHLPERYGAAGLPAVQLVDLRTDAPERGAFLSPVARRALLETLARGEQVLFFLNRRGYAPLLLCRTCGHRFQCADCSAWLTMHGKKASGSQVPGSSKESAESWNPEPGTFLSCHHCGHKESMPNACPACNAEASLLAPCGPGVERIAEEIRGMFGGVTGGKWQVANNRPSVVNSPPVIYHPSPVTSSPSLAILSSDESIAAETWGEIESGQIDILVGTQMVAKGHHFPRLTLVVVVDADIGLSGADLRAGERTYQLLHQLGGRAGRGELPGTVLVQTYAPGHPVMQSLAAHDRDRLMQLEANERRAGHWPPFGQLAALLLDGADEQKVKAAGQALARSAPDDARLTILGPAPAPLSKLRGQFRYRILVKAESGIHLQRTLRAWLEGKKFPGVRIKVDVNPYYFL